MYSSNILLFVILLMCTIQDVENKYIYQINANSCGKHFSHFWRSTGFCPPEPRNNISNYFLRGDVKLNLILIASLPNAAIKYIRIHWLLDLLVIRSFSKNNSPEYDFKNLDSLIDFLHYHKLRPNFELMGNQYFYFNDFLNPKQKREWANLVRKIVQRYTDKYGIKYVSKWKFETWNEPDLKEYNTINFTLPGYLEYVDACALGLSGVRSQQGPASFKLGGPAGLFKSQDKHPLCWGLISKCGDSLNCPLNFISFHKKGDGSAATVLNKGLELVNYIHTHFPNLNYTPIANTEADILTGWSQSEEWRADVRYAAMVVKVVVDHYNTFVRDMGLNIEVLSNDNGFLNFHPYYFTQRTLLARFQMNNTSPPHVQFFKKPVYVAMALLSYLGNIAFDKPTQDEKSLVSFLATWSRKNVYELCCILSYVNDTIADARTAQLFDISVRKLPVAEYKYVIYVLNNEQSNAFKVWKKAGDPVFPDADVRAKMRGAEGPLLITGPKDLHPNASLHIQLNLTLPSIALLHICSKSGRTPGIVSKLQVFNVTHNEVLIVWKDTKVKTKCVCTYEIEFLSGDIGNKIDNQLFRRVNSDDVIFLWFHYAATGDKSNITHGWYRVRVMDYWGRFGPYSRPVKFPSAKNG